MFSYSFPRSSATFTPRLPPGHRWDTVGPCLNFPSPPNPHPRSHPTPHLEPCQATLQCQRGAQEAPWGLPGQPSGPRAPAQGSRSACAKSHGEIIPSLFDLWFPLGIAWNKLGGRSWGAHWRAPGSAWGVLGDPWQVPGRAWGVPRGP